MIVVDTGVLYAGADEDDDDHVRCAGLLADRARELVAPVPVLVETAWLIERRLGATSEARFLSAVVAEIERVDLADEEWERSAELISTYADLGLGLVDASVVAVAERLEVDEIATLDHRHFRVVRPRHVAAFVLLP